MGSISQTKFHLDIVDEDIEILIMNSADVHDLQVEFHIVWFAQMNTTGHVKRGARSHVDSYRAFVGMRLTSEVRSRLSTVVHYSMSIDLLFLEAPFT